MQCDTPLLSTLLFSYFNQVGHSWELGNQGEKGFSRQPELPTKLQKRKGVCHGIGVIAISSLYREYHEVQLRFLCQQSIENKSEAKRDLQRRVHW